MFSILFPVLYCCFSVRIHIQLGDCKNELADAGSARTQPSRYEHMLGDARETNRTDLATALDQGSWNSFSLCFLMLDAGDTFIITPSTVPVSLPLPDIVSSSECGDVPSYRNEGELILSHQSEGHRDDYQQKSMGQCSGGQGRRNVRSKKGGKTQKTPVEIICPLVDKLLL
jgi:hypothetical protein